MSGKSGERRRERILFASPANLDCEKAVRQRVSFLAIARPSAVVLDTGTQGANRFAVEEALRHRLPVEAADRSLSHAQRISWGAKAAREAFLWGGSDAYDLNVIERTLKTAGRRVHRTESPGKPKAPRPKLPGGISEGERLYFQPVRDRFGEPVPVYGRAVAGYVDEDGETIVRLRLERTGALLDTPLDGLILAI